MRTNTCEPARRFRSHAAHIIQGIRFGSRCGFPPRDDDTNALFALATEARNTRSNVPHFEQNLAATADQIRRLTYRFL